VASEQKRVLIIEDEKPLAHAQELKLQHEGFAASIATNGQDGLALHSQTPFTVILLDLMMPVMDGFQVLEALRQAGPMPTVFVLSNLSQREDEQRVLELGAAKYFIKSNTPLATIVEEVKNALHT
jgi:DNA-binding response OmpR family regulator